MDLRGIVANQRKHPFLSIFFILFQSIPINCCWLISIVKFLLYLIHYLFKMRHPISPHQNHDFQLYLLCSVIKNICLYFLQFTEPSQNFFLLVLNWISTRPFFSLVCCTLWLSEGVHVLALVLLKQHDFEEVGTQFGFVSRNSCFSSEVMSGI